MIICWENNIEMPNRLFKYWFFFPVAIILKNETEQKLYFENKFTCNNNLKKKKPSSFNCLISVKLRVYVEKII